MDITSASCSVMPWEATAVPSSVFRSDGGAFLPCAGLDNVGLARASTGNLVRKRGGMVSWK